MNIAQRIPARIRTIVYVVLGVASAAQASFEVLPADTWGRVLGFASLLGFTVAAGNVSKGDE